MRSFSHLTELINCIKSAVVLGIGSALQRHGVNGTAAVTGHIYIFCRQTAFDGVCRLESHGFTQLVVGQLKIRAHLLHGRTVRCKLTGSSQCIPGLNPVLFFSIFLFKILCFSIRHSIHCVRTIIANDCNTVHAQRVQSHTRSYGRISLGAAQG